MAPRSVIQPTSSGVDVDRLKISIINGAMILVFFLTEMGLGTWACKGIYDRMEAAEQKQVQYESDRKADAVVMQQVLTLLQSINSTTSSHTKSMEDFDRKLDTVIVTVNGMKERSNLIYSDRFGTYDNYLAWQDFISKNPLLHLIPPDIYTIRSDHPPINPPFQ